MNENQNQAVEVGVVKSKAGRKRTRFTKAFKVVKNIDGTYSFAGSGKPANGSVRAEVILPVEHNRENGIPVGAAIVNEKTVTYAPKVNLPV